MKNLSIALCAFLLVVGCSHSDSSGSGSTAQAGGGGGKIKIAYIPKNTGNPYFTEVNKGFIAAAKEYGMELTTIAPATADATSQIPIIKDQVQRGVDIIAISANSPDALNPALDDARAHGITVITVDSDLMGNETHRDAAVLPTDFTQVGKAQVELLGSLIDYEGDIAILSATTDAPNQNAWIADMEKTLKDPKYSKMHLIEKAYGDDEPQKSSTECEALLSKHAGLRGIISPTAVGLAACAQVIERAGVYPGGAQAKGKGLQITGLSTPNQLKKAVQKGIVTSLQLWQPSDEGYLAAYLGKQIREKKVKPAAGATLDVPKFGKRTFSPKLEITGGPLITFDKKNIEKYNF